MLELLSRYWLAIALELSGNRSHLTIFDRLVQIDYLIKLEFLQRLLEVFGAFLFWPTLVLMRLVIDHIYMFMMEI